MRKATRRGVAIVIAAAILMSAGPTRAQPAADFYRGKTLRMLIGYGPGGGRYPLGREVPARTPAPSITRPSFTPSASDEPRTRPARAKEP